MLYCGVAFFEYKDGSFWPEFSRVVGSPGLTVKMQDEANQQFEHCAKYLKLGLRHHSKRGDYVGSAVYLAGVPVAVWGDFIPLCYWALWCADWEQFSQGQWESLVGKRCGGHRRLQRFLTDNRDLATAFLREMIELRQRMEEQPESARELAQKSRVRREYIDEVPETAEFLIPKNPGRLNRERVSLAFNYERGEIYLRLPAVEQANLPADWKIGNATKAAGGCPDRITLNSEAFRCRLAVALTPSSGERDRRCLPGAAPWGIFDFDDDGTLVNPERTRLPTGRYALVSPEPLAGIVRRGLSEEDYPPNDRFELSDRTTCFVTRLEPNHERASLAFESAKGRVCIEFRPRERIEHLFLPPYGQNLACFQRKGDVYHTQGLPTLGVSVPPDFFGGADTDEQLAQNFRVQIVAQSPQGKWRSFHGDGSTLKYFRWEWRDPDRPVMEKRQSGDADSLQEIVGLFDIPEMYGNLTISIESPEHRQEWKILRERRRLGLEDHWKNLPGDFLPITLLSHAERGMSWDEIVLARNAIFTAWKADRATLYKYSEYGFTKQDGAKWRIAKSRAAITEKSDGTAVLDYCGNSGTLWALYCRFGPDEVGHLPRVGVVAATAEFPAYLQMVWKPRVRSGLESFLEGKGVEVGESLWIR